MFDDLHTYFHENVLRAYGTYADAKKEMSTGQASDLRLAINAAIALFHFREHFPPETKKSRAEVARVCPDYDLIGDIANASKHRRLTRGNPLISGASDIYEQIICTLYRDAEGEYRNVEKSVFVKRKDGSERDVFDAATNVMNMWLNLVFELGIENKNKKIVIVKVDQPISRSSSRENLTLHFTRGVGATQRFKLQQFNYSTNCIEPVDLSDSKMTFSIYKPMYVATLTGTDEKKRDKFVVEIKLSEKQRSELEKLGEHDDLISKFLEMALDQGISNGDLIKQDGKVEKIHFERKEK